MRAKPLIDRIKAECPTFASRVSGMAELGIFVDAGNSLAVPCAFVLRTDEFVEPSQTAGVVTQVIEEGWAVLVAVSTTADTRGYDADNALDDIREELRLALVNWQPDTEHSPIEYRGFTNIDFDVARLWRRFDFSTLRVE
jgi:hypothetical protein